MQSDATFDPPPELLKAVRATAVRPLFSPLKRTLLVSLVAMLAGSGLILGLGLRHDLAALPSPEFAITILLRLAAGVLLIGLSLREGVPSRQPSTPATIAVVSAALVMLLTTPVWLAALTGVVPMPLRPSDFFCFAVIVVVSAPGLSLAAWMLGRAYPLRTWLAGALAALGTAILADAALLLFCPKDAASHALLVHTPAIVMLATSGAVIGSLLQRARDRRLRRLLGPAD